MRWVNLKIYSRTLIYQILSNVCIFDTGDLLFNPSEYKIDFILLIYFLGHFLLFTYDIDFIIFSAMPYELEILDLLLSFLCF